ncbi:hypothetical protein EVAR_77589_1 [Eumeta japonica]|uniref:Uncharacterized protein n=1 Tax=Eumeta variegata TaxID=151549 RepID=A0A4C1T7N4_EUMVA|nr:hypothetical protein EVAR_77589_1 [Eumeta japonica]
MIKRDHLTDIKLFDARAQQRYSTLSIYLAGRDTHPDSITGRAPPRVYGPPAAAAGGHTLLWLKYSSTAMSINHLNVSDTGYIAACSPDSRTADARRPADVAGRKTRIRLKLKRS